MMTKEERIAEKERLDQIRKTMRVPAVEVARIACLSIQTISNYGNHILSERALRDYRCALEQIVEETKQIKVKEN